MTIPLTRCQFLIPFADICDEIGAPTEALLSKLRLPVSLEEKADHYIPIHLAIRFAEVAQRSQGITDIGFQAARRLQFGHLSERLRTEIRFSPTLLVALQQLCKWASLEDTNVSVWLERDADRVRICKSAGTSPVPHLENSQWLQNVMSMYVVRQFAGPDWVPRRWRSGPAMNRALKLARSGKIPASYRIRIPHGSIFPFHSWISPISQARRRRLRMTTTLGRPGTKSSRQSN